MIIKPSKTQMYVELYEVNRYSQHRIIKSKGIPDSGNLTVKLSIHETMWWERKGIVY